MPGLFDEVRERVTAEEAARFYGLEVKNHRAICPWHRDTHPSLSFKGLRCKCFVCGNGGSCIDLTGQLLRLGTLDAAKRINRDFKLGLDLAAPRPTGPTRTEQRQQFQEWRADQLQKLRVLRDSCAEFLASYAPENVNSTFYQALKQYADLRTQVEQIENLNFEDYEEGWKNGRKPIPEHTADDQRPRAV